MRFKINLKHFICLASGALTTLAFAPFNIWPLAVLMPAILLLMWDKAPAKQAFIYGYLYGLGLFATGASWIYVSIHRYGEASPLVAALVTATFVLYLSLFYGLNGYCLQRYFARIRWQKLLFFFPISWVIFEWFRGWCFTGFPWLYLGYAALPSPMAGFAPIFGVYGLSALMLLMSATFTIAMSRRSKHILLATLFSSLLCLTGFVLTFIPWTQATEQQATVTLVQANIPQDLKWQRQFAHTALERHLRLSEPYWQKSDIIIWPEAAITEPLPFSKSLVSAIASKAKLFNHSFISGIPARNEEGFYYNGMLAVGHQASGYYAKYHLVPFGEYVPFKEYLADLLALFNVPATMSYGPRQGQPLTAGGLVLSPAICYEVAYPERFLQHIDSATALITLSNDTWFGHSIGPFQHLQISQMRALEAGRNLIRATNNGITALIDHQGKVYQQVESFTETVLNGQVQARTGYTPIAWYGHHSVLWGLFLLGLGLWLRRIRAE